MSEISVKSSLNDTLTASRTHKQRVKTPLRSPHLHDPCVLQEQMFVPYPLHALRSQGGTTCHTKPFPIPGSKTEIQQISVRRCFIDFILETQTSIVKWDVLLTREVSFSQSRFSLLAKNQSHFLILQCLSIFWVAAFLFNMSKICGLCFCGSWFMVTLQSTS